MTDALNPGATLGVLGGGQLGRMFALAAHRLGFRVAVYSEEERPPGCLVVDRYHRAPYDDLDRVAQFAREVDAVTFEFENVPMATAAAAAEHAPVRPSGELLHTTQNRQREKQFLSSLGLPIADYVCVTEESHLEPAMAKLPGASLMKTSAFGYDGHGQLRLQSGAEIPDAWRQLSSQPVVIESIVPFEREISVVCARGLDGQVVLYPPFENRHANQILDLTLWPAAVPESCCEQAWSIARSILEGFEIVGVICIEMFVLANGDLLVNEIAPRPHNSGHLTIDAHRTCQFEQQARAVAGLPLGDITPHQPYAAMANLLGDVWTPGEPAWSEVLRMPDVHLHLYGKSDARPGRKMGHITAIGEDPKAVEERALEARRRLIRS